MREESDKLSDVYHNKVSTVDSTSNDCITEVLRIECPSAVIALITCPAVSSPVEKPAPTVSASPASTRPVPLDRKSTRLNSSHSQISYAVFCLKKKRYGQQVEITKLYTYCMCAA